MRSKSKLVAATVAAVGSLGLTVGATAVAQIGSFPGSQGDPTTFNSAFNNALNEFSEGHFGTLCDGAVYSSLQSFVQGMPQLPGGVTPENVADAWDANACGAPL